MDDSSPSVAFNVLNLTSPHVYCIPSAIAVRYPVLPPHPQVHVISVPLASVHRQSYPVNFEKMISPSDAILILSIDQLVLKIIGYPKYEEIFNHVDHSESLAFIIIDHLVNHK